MPITSIFFDSPNSLFLLRLISLVPLFRGFINPAIVRFQKELEFSKTTFEFIKLIIGDGIIEHLEDIVNKYSAILRAINKEIKVKIQAAYRQDKKTLDEIKEVLSKKFGRKIILEFSENKDLIGGFRIIANGQAFDCSVKGELEQMREMLK